MAEHHRLAHAVLEDAHDTFVENVRNVSMDDALDVLFNQAGVDGLFSDFPDTVVHWLQKNGKR